MKSTILFLLLLINPPQKIPGIYHNDRITYKLTFFRDGTFENGTKGHPRYTQWDGCHTEGGTYRVSGDSVYMYLTYVDGMSAVNDNYGRGILRGDSLDIFFYDDKNGPYSYNYIGPLEEPLSPEGTGVYLFIWK